jgi:hypothetical protein
MKTKLYTNLKTNAITANATFAKQWHNTGDNISVTTADENGKIIKSVFVKGAKVETDREKTDRENWEHCKSVSNELDAYIDENYHICPYCNEKVYIPDTVGDKFKCDHCGTVDDVENYDALGLWDYMQDMLDLDFIINSRKEYSACRICVAYGGPSIYIDTDEKAVCLYWWSDSAKYYLRSDTVNAVDEWAEDYYNSI